MAGEKFPTMVNPHALEAILAAGEARDLVASQDIYDDRGTKLLARDKQISRSLRERLMERKLRKPLETTLKFAKGLSSADLREGLLSVFEADDVLGKMVQPWAKQVNDQVMHLVLQPVVQLLMTTMAEARQTSYRHALRGMALAGAMAARVGAAQSDLRLAMLGGLLHDLGEMYVDSSYLDGSKPIETPMYRHVIAHPRIAELLLAGLGEYPPPLTRAIGEHHERLDGTGYPSQQGGARLSVAGRMLAVVETTLGVLSAPDATCALASFSLRAVPGEYDGTWTGFVSSAAQRLREKEPEIAASQAEALRDRLRQLNAAMLRASEVALEFTEMTDPAWVRRVALRGMDGLARIRAGWNALGLWVIAESAGPAEVTAEQVMAFRDIRFRLRALKRECVWPEAGLKAEDTEILAPFWDCLSSGG